MIYACIWECRFMCLSAHVEDRGQCCVSSSAFHFSFCVQWEPSLWAWSSQSWLDWLASNPWEIFLSLPSLLHIPSTKVTDMCYHTMVLCGCWRRDLSFSCLYSKHFNMGPSPQRPFINSFFNIKSKIYWTNLQEFLKKLLAHCMKGPSQSSLFLNKSNSIDDGNGKIDMWHSI